MQTISKRLNCSILYDTLFLSLHNTLIDTLTLFNNVYTLSRQRLDAQYAKSQRRTRDKEKDGEKQSKEQLLSYPLLLSEEFGRFIVR